MAIIKFLGGNGISWLFNKIKSLFISKDDVKEVSAVDVDLVPTQDSQNLVSSGGVFSVLGKWGVVSQTISWTGNDNDGYVKGDTTNVVKGLIPQVFIDEVCSLDPGVVIFNETTGYFEYKGVTDLSYNEMLESYKFGEMFSRDRLPGGYSLSDTYEEAKLFRVIIANLRIYGAAQWTNTFNFGFQVLSYLEILDFTPVVLANIRHAAWSGNAYETPTGMRRLRIVKGISFEKFTTAKTFTWPSIETLEIFKLRGDLTLAKASKLTLASVVYIVTYANNSTAITITLHATAYARCQADTTEYTYNSQTYTGILALASAHNITIASA